MLEEILSVIAGVTIFEETAAVFEKVKIYAVPGAEQTMDRLEEHLVSIS
ncbi:hypothetical protein QFZ77_002938 [Paenibacillus sp. V4I3]|jgi:hypothetical protein|nr:hypothetical protein [Paenibacillus sp. V4I3]MDQ0887822.1 hypothetical protein [Paenibacillus sp. V4I9]MDQ0897467.1 hypothetical protein [Paenibacillus sp. V4I7]